MSALLLLVQVAGPVGAPAAVTPAPAPAAAAPPARAETGTTPSPDAADDALIVQAALLIHAGKSAEALAKVEQVINDEERLNKGEKGLIFSARSTQEMLLYAILATKQKRDAVMLGPNWSTALFLKGFALVDLGRGDEAKPFFDRAIALAPMNAQFLAERGEWFKARRQWAAAYEQFKMAADDADFAPEADKSFEKRRALRGMAYVRSEQGKLDEAENLDREVLKIDPSDQTALHELEWIREQRAKQAPERSAS